MFMFMFVKSDFIFWYKNKFQIKPFPEGKKRDKKFNRIYFVFPFDLLVILDCKFIAVFTLYLFQFGP